MVTHVDLSRVRILVVMAVLFCVGGNYFVFRGLQNFNNFQSTVLGAIAVGIVVNETTALGYGLAFWKAPAFRKWTFGVLVYSAAFLSLIHGIIGQQTRTQLPAEPVVVLYFFGALSVQIQWWVFSKVRNYEVDRIIDYSDSEREFLHLGPNDGIEAGSLKSENFSLQYLLFLIFGCAVVLSLATQLNVKFRDGFWMELIIQSIMFAMFLSAVEVILFGIRSLAYIAAQAELIESWITTQVIALIFVLFLGLALTSFGNPMMMVVVETFLFAQVAVSWFACFAIRRTGLRYLHYVRWNADRIVAGQSQTNPVTSSTQESAHWFVDE